VRQELYEVRLGLNNQWHPIQKPKSWRDESTDEWEPTFAYGGEISGLDDAEYSGSKSS
jgi:hypothetical protein